MIKHISRIKEKIGDIVSIREEEIHADTTEEMIEILNFKDFLSTQNDEMFYEDEDPTIDEIKH